MQLTDPKGRMHQIVLQPGAAFHTHRGALAHDDLIGAPEGSVVTATSGTQYVALRPLLADYTLAMKRGATIVYPKDAAQILAYADIGGMALLDALRRAPATEYLLTEQSGEVYGVLAARDLDQVFAGV